MKKLILLVLAVLLAAALYFLIENPLGRAVKAAAEQLLPAMTQSRVSIGRVNISVSDGTGEIKDFQLGNPAGFKTPYAFKADAISLVIEPASLQNGVVMIRSVLIDAPDINFEQSDAGSNFDVLQRNVADYLRTQKGEGSKMIVGSLIIRKTHVNYDGSLSLDLSDIELHDMGKKEGGVAPARIVKDAVGALKVKAALAVPGAIVDKVGSAFKGLFSH